MRGAAENKNHNSGSNFNGITFFVKFVYGNCVRSISIIWLKIFQPNFVQISIFICQYAYLKNDNHFY